MQSYHAEALPALLALVMQLKMITQTRLTATAIQIVSSMSAALVVQQQNKAAPTGKSFPLFVTLCTHKPQCQYTGASVTSTLCYFTTYLCQHDSCFRHIQRCGDRSCESTCVYKPQYSVVYGVTQCFIMFIVSLRISLQKSLLYHHVPLTGSRTRCTHAKPLPAGHSFCNDTALVTMLYLRLTRPHPTPGSPCCSAQSCVCTGLRVYCRHLLSLRGGGLPLPLRGPRLPSATGLSSDSEMLLSFLL